MNTGQKSYTPHPWPHVIILFVVYNMMSHVRVHLSVLCPAVNTCMRKKKYIGIKEENKLLCEKMITTFNPN